LSVRIFSYGGGVQSTAVLVLASQGKVQYDHFLFANVGEDSEHPDTLEYFRDIALPFAKEHGLDLQEVRKYRKGEIETIRGLIFGERRTIPIPAYLNSGKPGNRSCTIDFKIKVIDRWVKNHIEKRGVFTIGLGISIDEWKRARNEPKKKIYKGLWKEIEYPLLDMRISRKDCLKAIQSAGLPNPPKSSCYFCPFHTNLPWHEMRQNRPDLFWDAVKIEKHLQDKRKEMWGKDKVWLHRKLIPLDQAIPDQPFLINPDELNDDNCESGYCFT